MVGESAMFELYEVDVIGCCLACPPTEKASSRAVLATLEKHNKGSKARQLDSCRLGRHANKQSPYALKTAKWLKKEWDFACQSWSSPSQLECLQCTVLPPQTPQGQFTGTA